MSTPRWQFCFAFVIWLSASITGMTVLWNHQAEPGLAAEAPQQWPGDSRLVRSDSGSTMLVWIHPRCPCSRATVAELERLLVHVPDQTGCQIILSRPSGCDDAFVDSSLTRDIRRIPKVSVVVDDDQTEAARFGVATSGQVLLYGSDAGLLFSGGITPGRGHEGDSIGSASLRELFRRQHQASQTLSPTKGCDVYGCGLFGSPPEPSQTR